MRDYKCNDCDYEFEGKSEILCGKEYIDTICPQCRSLDTKRLWPKAINMNGHGFKNGFEGNKKCQK
jgi:hypothetical protein